MRVFFGRTVCAITVVLFAFTMPLAAQITVIHQEGFNDDGVADGRYSMTGRGQLIGGDGPGAWEHNFLVDAIGLATKAPARRAGILWTDVATEDDFTTDSLQVWDNLISYMLDSKEGATVGFLPDTLSESATFLSERLEEQGHSIYEFLGDPVPDASELDLVIHTSGANPPSPTDFVDYPVPLISYHAGNHDDTAISSIGSVTSAGPTSVSIVEANKDHPVLAGVSSGEIAWIDDFISDAPMQGIGGAQPAGSTTLATYVDPDSGLTLPAVLLIEEDSDLLGAFAPTPEGEGFIIGGDLNLDFGEGDGAGSPENPVTLTLNEIDLSGQSGVKISVDLAATTVDFEPADFIRILYATSEGAEPEDAILLAEFAGLDDAGSPNNKSLVAPDLGALKADEFTTFTFDVPDDVDNLVLKFEAFSTFPNEVMGIDNVVVFTGEELLCDPNNPGDFDGNNMVDFSDFLILSSSFGNAGTQADGDADCSGTVDFADFLVLSTNFGQAVGAKSVPEPSGLAILLLGGLGIASARRRRL